MKWQSADLHRRLIELLGVTAEIVRSPGDCWSDPQVEANPGRGLYTQTAVRTWDHLLFRDESQPRRPLTVTSD